MPSYLDVDAFLLVLAHSYSFPVTSGQWTSMVELRHLLTKDCSLLEVACVAFHVSWADCRDCRHDGVKYP